MMQAEDKATDFLRTLIVVNNDRQMSFDSAKSEVKEENLKAWFEQMSLQSKSYKEELMEWLPGDGQHAELSLNQTSLSGKVYRIWMEIKSMLSNHDTVAILSSCEFGEDAALKLYNEVLENQTLFSPELYEIIRRHMLKIKEDFNMLVKLRKLEESDV